MAITIRELLASDTISQAADKINFNFDQLLLNGGGPQGPQGPQGPPGPIGGRGIRGSVWYEDISTTSPGNNPNTVPPTLTPEDEDNYLQFNGVVWTYDASIPAWVPTNIDLTGPVGPPGASGKFAEYQALPYTAAGDTTIFPDEISLSPIGLTQGVRSVLIGGFPETVYNLTPPITAGTNIVPTAIANQLQMPYISMMVHQFNASGRGIVFHGGDATEDFEQSLVTDLSSIGISNDDLMVITVPKAPTVASTSPDLDGLRVLTPSRNQHFQAGKRIWLQAGTSSTQYGAGDLASVWIETDRNNASIPDPTIELRVYDSATPDYEAELRLGGIGTAPGTSSKQGDFWVEAGLIGILSSGNTTVNSGQGINMTAVNNIVATSSSGDIRLNATLGELFSTSQTVDVNATTDIDINAGSTIDMIGAGLVTVQSTGNNLKLWATDNASLVDVFSGDDVDVHAKDGDVHIFTDTGTGGDVLIDTNNTGSQIKLETTSNTSPINLITNGTTSQINLETTDNDSPINLTTSGAFPQPSDINISTTGIVSQINLSSIWAIHADAPTIDLTASNSIDLNTTAAGDIILDTTAGTGNITLDSGDQIAIIADTVVGIVSTNSNVNIIASSGDINMTASVIDLTASSSIDLNTTAAADIILDTTAGTGDIILESGADVNIEAAEVVSVTGKAQIGDQTGPVELATAHSVSITGAPFNDPPWTYSYTTPIKDYDRMIIIKTNEIFNIAPTAMRLKINASIDTTQVFSKFISSDGGFNASWEAATIYLTFFLPANTPFSIYFNSNQTTWAGPSPGSETWTLKIFEQRLGKQ